MNLSTILTALRRRPAAGPGPVCEVREFVWDVWDQALDDGIHHLEPPCGAPAVALVRTSCPACGHQATENACAECAGYTLPGPHLAQFDGACPVCAYPAHYTIHPTRKGTTR